MTDAQRPHVPAVLRRLSTDEYDSPPYDDLQRRALDEVLESGPEVSRRVAKSLGAYWTSRLGTAAALRSLNASFGVDCYAVPEEATTEQAAADEAFAGTGLVVDAQTHYMADRDGLRRVATGTIEYYRALAPDWWSGLEGMVYYGLAEYLRCVYAETETAVAVLTAPPPDSQGEWFLTNDELAGTRELIDRLAGTGRLLSHTVVHPNDPGVLERMEQWRDIYHPVGWKVYTMGKLNKKVALQEAAGEIYAPGSGWMLDDEEVGLPFLEEARRLGVMNICSHKGLSHLVDNGSPRDIGPCARAFPDLRFLVYHSGFEGVAADEGPFTEETVDEGINRLISSAMKSGIGPGGNIYAELGTTWFCLIKRPIEAAHVLGKLLVAFGEDNIVWGTDSIWYGPAQPAIDALRSFQIPPSLREEYGYPELTPAIKEKILGANAARLYGIDLDAAAESMRRDELSWIDQAVAEA